LHAIVIKKLESRHPMGLLFAGYFFYFKLMAFAAYSSSIRGAWQNALFWLLGLRWVACWMRRFLQVATGVFSAKVFCFAATPFPPSGQT
jgi:hypothetical protein